MLDLVDPAAPDGGFDARTGWAGMMKPVGRRDFADGGAARGVKFMPAVSAK
jgi:hypothetical protein